MYTVTGPVSECEGLPKRLLKEESGLDKILTVLTMVELNFRVGLDAKM